MLIIRGGFEGALRTQAIHACMDTVENMLRAAVRTKGLVYSRLQVAGEFDPR